MKPKYKTFFTRKAYNDLRSIYKYIREELQKSSSAINIVNDIEERIGLLEDFLLTGNLVRDPGLHAKGYRKLIINNLSAIKFRQPSSQLENEKNEVQSVSTLVSTWNHRNKKKLYKLAKCLSCKAL